MGYWCKFLPQKLASILTHSGCNNIWITQSEFVAITQFFFVFGTNNLCETAVQALKDLPWDIDEASFSEVCYLKYIIIW